MNKVYSPIPNDQHQLWDNPRGFLSVNGLPFHVLVSYVPEISYMSKIVNTSYFVAHFVLYNQMSRPVNEKPVSLIQYSKDRSNTQSSLISIAPIQGATVADSDLERHSMTSLQEKACLSVVRPCCGYLAAHLLECCTPQGACRQSWETQKGFQRVLVPVQTCHCPAVLLWAEQTQRAGGLHVADERWESQKARAPAQVVLSCEVAPQHCQAHSCQWNKTKISSRLATSKTERRQLVDYSNEMLLLRHWRYPNRQLL